MNAVVEEAILLMTLSRIRGTFEGDATRLGVWCTTYHLNSSCEYSVQPGIDF